MSNQIIEDRLLEWHNRLDSHFNDLMTNMESGHTIFGLEHDLTEYECDELAKDIRNHILTNSPSKDHRMAWVVYATEIGYKYSGYEYWQTFESSTPGWINHGDRYWMRKCFKDFHDKYNGAIPTGPWARHFSIICWPITHAILPTDLQRHLAKTLYDIRDLISPEHLDSPLKLGKLIAAQSYGHSSSRFMQFTQEPLYVGQISTDLLFHGESRSATSFLLPSTLERIIRDLEIKQNARTWLKSARDSAQQKFKFAHVLGSKSIDNTKTSNLQREIGFKPKLILRKHSDDAWKVVLELPDMSSIPVRFPELRNILSNSSCKVTGSGRKGRGWLLRGSQQAQLSKFPSIGESLLEFDPPLPNMFKYIFDIEHLINPGPIWIFKILSDGQACEVTRANLHPGTQYIILQRDDVELDNSSSLPDLKISCEGVRASLLIIPNPVTNEIRELLEALEIPVVGTVEVWPVGLCPSRWDSEGSAEWLSVDMPRFGIRSDYNVREFQLKINFDEILVTPKSVGEPVFVELPRLRIGTHTIEILAFSSDDDESVESVLFDIVIRDPQVWVPGENNQGSFYAILEPRRPTLEQLLEKGFKIEIYGPNTYKLKCEVFFYEKGKIRPLIQKQLPSVPFPVANSDWQSLFHKHMIEPKAVQNKLELVERCTIHFSADELGQFDFTAEREFTPLRWIVQYKRDNHFLRLIDDHGSQSPPILTQFEFRNPDIPKSLDISSFTMEDSIEVDGGLYEANVSNMRCAVIIPPKVKKLEDLNIIFPEIVISKYKRNQDQIVSLVNSVDLWSSARFMGNTFSLIVRDEIISLLFQKTLELIAGKAWVQTENSIIEQDGNKALTIVESGSNYGQREFSITKIIFKQQERLLEMNPHERNKKLAYYYKSLLGEDNEDVYMISEFSLRLASNSSGLFESVAGNISASISHLLENPTLFRTARFMVLVLSKAEKSKTPKEDFAELWNWK